MLNSLVSPRALALSFALVLFGPAPAPAPAHAQRPAPDEAEAADRAEIRAILETGPVAIGPGTAGWEANFHPDWTVWFAGRDAVRLREPHMADVRDYVARGADVVAFDLDLVSLVIRGDTALARYNAVEHIVEGDGGRRDVAYSGTDLLVREEGRWLILATTVAFPDADGEAG